MSLTLLPNELLEMIIPHVLPEIFENLAITCKRFYALCVPFIKQHNAFRSRFRHFTYKKNAEDRACQIKSAFNLITHIANEPRIAHYIRSADFKIDGLIRRGFGYESRTHDHKNDAVMKLFANSIYLEEAGLDWQIYYANTVKELEVARWSQHAIVFLLTLLPNVEKLCLPLNWKPNDATNKLINIVVRKAQQSHLHGNKSSLAQLTKLEISRSLKPEIHFSSNWTYLFLALPRIQFFRGRSCVDIDDDKHNGFTMTLETVHFMSCCLDELTIAQFLKHSPRLRTFRYSHSTKDIVGDRDWKICEFVTAIKRETGNHLEGLSISTRDFSGSIVPGQFSMSGFQRLQKLELPLEMATFAQNGPLIDDFIPASVSQLSFISDGTNDHAQILKLIFRDFALRKQEKKSTLVALERIFLTCYGDLTDAYKEQCESLRAETKKADVAFEVRSYPPWFELRPLNTITWDEEDKMN